MIRISLEGFILESFWLDEGRASEHMRIFTSTKVFLYQSEFLEVIEDISQNNRLIHSLIQYI